MVTATLKHNGENTTNIARPVGFLTWWTIHQGIYNVGDLRSFAQEFPQSIRDIVQGADPKAAWAKATSITGSGIESYTGYHDRKARYLTRNLQGEERILIRETIDQNQKVVGVENIAVLKRDDVYIDAEVYQNSNRVVIDEVIKIITQMQTDMDSRIGNIDDTRIRQAILQWLNNSYRVSVRGSGGVYFVPTGTTRSPAEVVRKEILSVREWIGKNNIGSFSVIQLADDGTTSVSDFRQMAKEEILQELQDIADAVKELEKNEESTPGHALRSVNVLVEKQLHLAAKIKTLEESLTQVVGTVSGAYSVLNKKLVTLQNQRQNAVDTLAMSKPKSQPNQNGKSGTAKQRERKIKL